MSAVSNGRVLRIALAGSLAVHLIVAAVIYSHPLKVAAEQRPQRSDIIKIKVAPPTPTPPSPTPKPALPHANERARAVRPAIHRPKSVAVRPDAPPIAPPVEPTGNPVVPVDSPGPDAAPTTAPFVPTPTPKPACSAPDIPAKTLVAQTPAVSDDEREGFTGTAKVKVDLDASGTVVVATVYESTGNMLLDRAAVNAARESRYAPEERNCKNVPGSYLFTIDFQ